MDERKVERMGCVVVMDDEKKQYKYNRKMCKHFVTDNLFVSLGDMAKFNGKDGEIMREKQLQKEMKDLLFAWQEWEIGFIFGNTGWDSGLPIFSQEIFGKYLKIQAERERLLEKIEGGRENAENMPVV